MTRRALRESDRERVGSVLHDKWTLERLIGVGGMGAVYAARHRNGARAAVKIFSPVVETPILRERFLREGYAANKVEHPGAVKVLDDDVIDKGPDEGLAYLVMELLEGESLQERFLKEQLTERDLLEIADGVLAVLEAAHANGVVHRDLKPDNLFLVSDPERPSAMQIKVLDFGLARLIESPEHADNKGVAFGTPTYMSPEQAAGQTDKIDGRTDIYALGSILFQLSSNKRIHDAAHTLGLVVRMATTPAPKLQTVAPDASERFAAIVDRALAFDREARYPSATAMREDVRAALASPSAEPSTVNIVTSESHPEDESHPENETRMSSASFALRPTMPADPPSAKPRRRRWFRAGVVFVAAAAIGFFVILNRDLLVPASPTPIANIVMDDASFEDDDDDDDDAGDLDASDEEDIEVIDASVRADAARPVSSIVHRPHRTTTHPAAKKRVRRPNPHPRPKRKKRWHW